MCPIRLCAKLFHFRAILIIYFYFLLTANVIWQRRTHLYSRHVTWIFFFFLILRSTSPEITRLLLTNKRIGGSSWPYSNVNETFGEKEGIAFWNTRSSCQNKEQQLNKTKMFSQYTSKVHPSFDFSLYSLHVCILCFSFEKSRCLSFFFF